MQLSLQYFNITSIFRRLILETLVVNIYESTLVCLVCGLMRLKYPNGY